MFSKNIYIIRQHNSISSYRIRKNCIILTINIKNDQLKKNKMFIFSTNKKSMPIKNKSLETKILINNASNVTYWRYIINVK